MGIDVSGVFQARDREGWISLTRYYNGRRGLVRYWLGWVYGSGYQDLGVKPLVESPRGLPGDFEQLESSEDVGEISRSWLNVQEILDALPICSHRRCTVPLSIVRDLTTQKANMEQWKSATCLCEEMFRFEALAPRLIEVAPNWSVPSPSRDSVYVDYSFDFFDEDISDFEAETMGCTKFPQQRAGARRMPRREEHRKAVCGKTACTV